MSKKPDIHEARVSATYREAAMETTPAHLDRKVLEAARAGTRTRYGLARAWMRPLAWAATIALSFAFVLQMTLEDDVPAPAEMATPEEHADSVPAPAPAPVPASADSDVVELREASGEAIMKAKELNERAMSQAPARSVPEPAPAAASAATATAGNDAFAAAARIAGPAFCNAKARASATDWYECIEALREKGLIEAANAELEALQAEFPDFQVPVKD